MTKILHNKIESNCMRNYNLNCIKNTLDFNEKTIIQIENQNLNYK